jgi:hypothetical protein
LRTQRRNGAGGQSYRNHGTHIKPPVETWPDRLPDQCHVQQ